MWVPCLGKTVPRVALPSPIIKPFKGMRLNIANAAMVIDSDCDSNKH